MPPSFGDRSYWDTRFASGSLPFDWLLPAAQFISTITSSLTDSSPRILHIGCGTSSLSFHLRSLVRSPSQIYNIDFSDIATEAGRKQDEEMNWETLDLLSTQQILEFKKNASSSSSSSPRGEFTLVIDKSTADAISCAEDVDIELPYIINSDDNTEKANSETVKIHPLAVLSVHLAYLTEPGAKWLLLSYSSSRCDFLTSDSPGDRVVDQKTLDKGFPDPRLLWKVAKQEALDVPEINESQTVVARPVVRHTLYTLERTDLNLKLISR